MGFSQHRSEENLMDRPAGGTALEHRTVALIGGAGAGMTTLVEALLHRTGAIPRAGSIAAGTTVGDRDPEEIARGTTLNTALAYIEWTHEEDGRQRTLTLIDTPGHPDFLGAVDAALSVADLAAVVVSAVDGVTAGTRAAWSAAVAAGVPRVVVVSQLDKGQANFHRVLDDLKSAFGPSLLPIELPIGEEAEFRGIADVLSGQAFVYDGTGHYHVEEMPADLTDEETQLHTEVTEEIVSHDEALMESYFEGTEPSVEALEHGLAEEVVSGEAIPIVLASGVTETGVDRLADQLFWMTLDGREGRIVIGADGGEEIPVARDPNGETLVHVFSTVADPFVGQVSMLKVLSGTLKSGDRLRNATTGADERIHGLFRLRGTEHLPTDILRAGDVGAVSKLTGTPAGSLLWSRATGTARPVPTPTRHAVYAVALKPVAQADDEKLSTALARLTAEDPTLIVDRSTSVTVLRGLGDMQVAVAVERLARVFGVHVTTEPAPIAYRETISKKVDAEGRLKKQSGGHGQFAVVQLRVSPLPPGGGFEFVDSVVGGTVPRQYIPAVEKGALDAVAQGGPAGHPVVDIRVELYEGKSHAVDSSEMAFRTAGSLGVKAALQAAGTTVLEPVSTAVVTVPLDLSGTIMTDLNGRRGRVQTTETADDGRARIIATVPDVELQRYVLDLRSLTGGQAELSITPDRYEPAPGVHGR
jgi:elongation factor G